MFEHNSRYYPVEVATWQAADGRQVRYVRRRFLPRGDSLPLLAEVAVADGQRLDQIAAATLGDPEQYWRICDANDAMRPADLLATVGALLRVPLPQVEG
jgi:hypothetical protein